MIKYGTSEIGKRNYKVFIKLASVEVTGLSDSAGAVGTGNDAVRLGALAEQPKFTTDKGEEVALETGNKKNLSQVANFECQLMEVTEANYAELKNIINQKINVFMTDVVTLASVTISGGVPTAVSESGKQCVMIKNLYAFPALNIVGNDRNTINISGSKDTGAKITSDDLVIIEG